MALDETFRVIQMHGMKTYPCSPLPMDTAKVVPMFALVGHGQQVAVAAGGSLLLPGVAGRHHGHQRCWGGGQQYRKGSR